MSLLYHPKKPHFFQPLLHGFLSNFSIPKHFLKHFLNGGRRSKEGGVVVATLRDRRHKLWHVKMGHDGRRFEDGWEKFCIDHNMQVGDFVVFKLNYNYFFDVIIFDPSACERELPVDLDEDDDEDEEEDEDEDEDDSQGSDESASSSLVNDRRYGLLRRGDESEEVEEEDDDNDDDYEEEEEDDDDDEDYEDKPVKKSTSKKAGPTVCQFRITVTPSHLDTGIIVVPNSFLKKSGILKRIQNNKLEIELRDEQENSRTMELEQTMSETMDEKGQQNYHYCISGWPSFYKDHGFDIDHVVCFILVHAKDKPLLQFSREEDNVAPCKSSSYPFFRSIVTGSNLNKGITYIPTHFARKNGLIDKWCDMILEDEEGKTLTVQLRHGDGKKGPLYYLFRWPSFYRDYGLKKGDAVIFELVHNQELPIMKFYATKSEEANKKEGKEQTMKQDTTTTM